MVEVKFYDEADDRLLKFAVIIAKTDNKWVFCKHRERETYEVPGGHRENPNVCAVYTEKEYRNKGIALVYLITDHTSFYERYGWNFLCMVQGDGEEEIIKEQN